MIKKVLIHTPLLLIVVCLSFYMGLQIHFPTSILQKRVQYEVSKNSNDTMFVNIEKTNMEGLGLRFSNVQILQKERRKEEATELLFSPYISISIPFFSAIQGKPEADVSTELFGGTLSTSIMMDAKNNLSIKPQLSNLNAALLPLYGDGWELSFLGNLDLSGKLKFPVGKFSKAKGSLALKGNNLQLEEGKVLIKTLPSMTFTQTNIEISFEKGNANIKEGLLTSEALSMEIGGYIKLHDTPMKSKLYLTLKIETGEEIDNLIGALGKPYQDAEGNYNIKLLGNLSNPRFQTGNKPAKRPTPKAKPNREDEEEMDFSPPDQDSMEEGRVEPVQIDDEEKERRRQERIERARERREERLKKRKAGVNGFDKVLPTPRILPQEKENEEDPDGDEPDNGDMGDDANEPSEDNSNDGNDEDEPSDE